MKINVNLKDLIHNYKEDFEEERPVSKSGLVKAIICSLIFAFLYFYFALPPINIFASEFYLALTIVTAATTIFVNIFCRRGFRKSYRLSKHAFKFLVCIWAIYFVMVIVSAPIFHAKSYSRVLELQEGVFKDDVAEVDFEKIPVVDRDTAVKLGSRKMGEMGDLVSQYSIDPAYSQVTVNGKPMRNTPLVYSGLIKWLQNKSSGIPYYIAVDMADQEVMMVRLPEPIKYSFSDKFQRNIRRYIRFKYPTAIIDEINFEVDDKDHPYWVASTLKPTVGLTSYCVYNYDRIGIKSPD